MIIYVLLGVVLSAMSFAVGFYLRVRRCEMALKIAAIKPGEWFSMSTNPWDENTVVVLEVKGGWVRYKFACEECGIFGSYHTMKTPNFADIYKHTEKPAWAKERGQ